MPIYEFKCSKCKKNTEVFLTFEEHRTKTKVGVCSKKSCGNTLYRDNQVINFAGTHNMNASAMGIHQRKYSNKNGGPSAIAGPLELGRTGL